MGYFIDNLGIYVEQIFIKDMMITPDLQKSLSMTSKTERLSKAKIISASADVESAKLMHQAADILNSKAAMQIRYLEVLQNVSKGSGQKLLFMPLSNNEFDKWLNRIDDWWLNNISSIYQTKKSCIGKKEAFDIFCGSLISFSFFIYISEFFQQCLVVLEVHIRIKTQFFEYL